MMKAARSRQITLMLTLVATLVLLTVPAWAQGWGRRASSSAFGISFAYGGGDKGGRLELLSGQTVFDAGYFQDNDTDIYALELGWRGGEEGEALPFVVGTGYYYSRPEGGDSDGKLGFWAGLGEFTADKGLYYQLRYIFNGPLEGTQGCFGYRFR